MGLFACAGCQARAEEIQRLHEEQDAQRRDLLAVVQDLTSKLTALSGDARAVAALQPRGPSLKEREVADSRPPSPRVPPWAGMVQAGGHLGNFDLPKIRAEMARRKSAAQNMADRHLPPVIPAT